MKRHFWQIAWASLVLIPLMAGCRAEMEFPESRSFRIGIAPIPRNFPGSEEDWLDMFQRISEVGELATAQSKWRDAADKSGKIPEFFQLLGDQQGRFGYEPLFGINFFEQSGRFDALLQTEPSTANDWTSEPARAKYREVSLAICSTFRPRYFGLAIEVNEYVLFHAEDFERFQGFYRKLYREIKTTYPETQLFVTWQLEMLRGLGADTWGTPVTPRWDLLAAFEDVLDVAVFTTYPEIAYSSPAKIPDDYYREVQNHTSKRVAFSEIGWSSNRQSEKDQCDYITRFQQLTGGMDLEFVNWIFMHDLPGSETLNKTGLRKSDGTPKQSWTYWKGLREIPYTR